MPTASQKQTLINTISLIRSAEIALSDAGQQTTDPLELGKINLQYNALNSLMSQLSHALAIADDATFASTTTGLKQQAASLQAQEAQIKTIVTDVGTAAQIVGYIAQAASFLAAL